MDQFADKLAKKMVERRLTQEEVADLIGYDRATVSRWINKKIPPPSEIIQKELLRKMDEFESKPNESEVIEDVSKYLEKKIDRKFAEILSLGLVPVFAMEKLKSRYQLGDDKEKQKIEFLMEDLFKEDNPVMVKWIKDIPHED